MTQYNPAANVPVAGAALSGSRLLYLDACRGMCMLLVIYAHLVHLPMEFEVFQTSSVLNRLRMPVFFFISGFLMYSPDYSADLLRRRVRNRLLHQLYPTLLIWGFYLCTFYLPPWESWKPLHHMPFDTMKGGYWFTLVAFEAFVVLAPAMYLFSRHGLSDRRRVMWLVIAALTSIALLVVEKSLKCNGIDMFFGLFSLDLLCKNLFMVCAGAAARIYSTRFAALLGRWWAVPLALGCILLMRPHMGADSDKSLAVLALRVPYALCGVAVAVGVFMRLGRSRLGGVDGLLRLLARFGTATLEIYLLHYFLLSLLYEHTDWLMLQPLLNSPWQPVLYLAFSVAIAAGCLLAVRVLKSFNLYRYIFPTV